MCAETVCTAARRTAQPSTARINTPYTNIAQPHRHPFRQRIAGLAHEDGSASLEFIGIGLILLVPLAYLILALGAIQSASLSIEGAARHAARVYVAADSVASAETRASRAVEFALTDFGLDPDAATVQLRCSPAPQHCLRANSRVEVLISYPVTLPLVPPILAEVIPLQIQVTAQAEQIVSRFGGAR